MLQYDILVPICRNFGFLDSLRLRLGSGLVEHRPVNQVPSPNAQAKEGNHRNSNHPHERAKDKQTHRNLSGSDRVSGGLVSMGVPYFDENGSTNEAESQT